MKKIAWGGVGWTERNKEKRTRTRWVHWRECPHTTSFNCIIHGHLRAHDCNHMSKQDLHLWGELQGCNLAAEIPCWKGFLAIFRRCWKVFLLFFGSTKFGHFLKGRSLKGRCNICVYVPVCVPVCVPRLPPMTPPILWG